MMARNMARLALAAGLLAACAGKDRFSCDNGDHCVDYLYDLTADEAAESCSGEVLEGNVCESLGEVVGMCHAEEGTPTPLAAYLFSSDYDATSAEAWCTDGGGRFEAP